MKTLFVAFLLALVLSTTVAFRHQTLSLVEKKQIDKLRTNKGTWASFVLDLAQLHAQTGGPLDELVDAIQGVIDDLDNKLDRAEEEHQKRTERHDDDVKRLNGQIDSAAQDIAGTTEYVNFLQSEIARLNGEVVELEQDIATNQSETEAAIVLREKQHAEFLEKVPEHEEAIAALDEALEVLSQLLEDGLPSLIQTKKLKKSAQTLQHKIKSGADKAFIQALLSLTTNTEFADQGAIRKVAQLMRDTKSNLQNALYLLQDNEKLQQAQYEQDLENFARELSSFQLQLIAAHEQIAQTESTIVEAREFLELRKQDKQRAEDDLQAENESFDRDTKAFEELVAQIESESAACNQAASFLNNAEFADYIGDRVQQDVILNQPHGQPVPVESNIYTGF